MLTGRRRLVLFWFSLVFVNYSVSYNAYLPTSESFPPTCQLSITKWIYYFVMQRYGYKHHMTFGLTFRSLGTRQLRVQSRLSFSLLHDLLRCWFSFIKLKEKLWQCLDSASPGAWQGVMYATSKLRNDSRTQEQQQFAGCRAHPSSSVCF